MAWIESHQSLGSHIKLRRLARELHICRPQAVGHLQYLWWWALDNAPSGDLSALAPAEIAEAAEWTGSEEKFLAALTACGWVDQETMHLHKWSEYAGRLITERERDRERKRLKRMGHGSSEELADIPRDVRRNSSGQAMEFRDRPKEIRRSPAVPNPTQPNPTLEDTHTQGSGVSSDGPVDPPPGMPQTDRDAMKTAAAVGCPEAVAVDEWHRANARGWVDARGIPIRNWASYLRSCWTAAQSRKAEADARGAAGRPNGKPVAGERREIQEGIAIKQL